MPRIKKTPTKSTEKKQTVSSKLLVKVKVYDAKGNEKESVAFPKEIFSVTASPKLLAQYVRVYLANQRQGTASTKTRGEVVGSTKKIYRQKGTGRARHGDIKAPIFVGGGVVGGPKPKDYSLKMNKKQRRRSLFLALSLKQKDNAILQAEKELIGIAPKTKLVVQFLKAIGILNEKILFVFPKMETNNLILASRNIPGVYFSDAPSLNAYAILNADKIVFIDDALSVLKKHFIKNEN
jgi:large subunit ribosomal protein L4